MPIQKPQQGILTNIASTKALELWRLIGFMAVSSIVFACGNDQNELAVDESQSDGLNVVSLVSSNQNNVDSLAYQEFSERGALGRDDDFVSPQLSRMTLIMEAVESVGGELEFFENQSQEDSDLNYKNQVGIGFDEGPPSPAQYLGNFYIKVAGYLNELGRVGEANLLLSASAYLMINDTEAESVYQAGLLMSYLEASKPSQSVFDMLLKVQNNYFAAGMVAEGERVADAYIALSVGLSETRVVQDTLENLHTNGGFDFSRICAVNNSGWQSEILDLCESCGHTSNTIARHLNSRVKRLCGRNINIDPSGSQFGAAIGTALQAVSENPEDEGASARAGMLALHMEPETVTYGSGFKDYIENITNMLNGGALYSRRDCYTNDDRDREDPTCVLQNENGATANGVWSSMSLDGRLSYFGFGVDEWALAQVWLTNFTVNRTNRHRRRRQRVTGAIITFAGLGMDLLGCGGLCTAAVAGIYTLANDGDIGDAILAAGLSYFGGRMFNFNGVGVGVTPDGHLNLSYGVLSAQLTEDGFESLGLSVRGGNLIVTDENGLSVTVRADGWSFGADANGNVIASYTADGANGGASISTNYNVNTGNAGIGVNVNTNSGNTFSVSANTSGQIALGGSANGVSLGLSEDNGRAYLTFGYQRDDQPLSFQGTLGEGGIFRGGFHYVAENTSGNRYSTTIRFDTSGFTGGGITQELVNSDDCVYDDFGEPVCQVIRLNMRINEDGDFAADFNYHSSDGSLIGASIDGDAVFRNAQGDLLVFKNGKLTRIIEASPTGRIIIDIVDGEFKVRHEGNYLGIEGPQLPDCHSLLLDRLGYCPEPLASIEFGQCFVAGTPVHTSKGIFPIENIGVGDKVRCADPVRGAWEFCSVEKRYVRQYNDSMIDIEFGGEVIHSTAEHPFWVAKGKELHKRPDIESLEESDRPNTAVGRFVKAEDLRVDDQLLKQNGALVKIESVRHKSQENTVYNFDVDRWSTYSVGQNGVLVHNADYDALSQDELLKARLDRALMILNGGNSDASFSYLAPNESVLEELEAYALLYTNADYSFTYADKNRVDVLVANLQVDELEEEEQDSLCADDPQSRDLRNQVDQSLPEYCPPTPLALEVLTMLRNSPYAQLAGPDVMASPSPILVGLNPTRTQVSTLQGLINQLNSNSGDVLVLLSRRVGTLLGNMGSILHRDEDQNGIADNVDGSLPENLRYNETFTQQVVDKIVLDMVVGVVVLVSNPRGVAHAIWTELSEELAQFSDIYNRNLQQQGVLGIDPGFAIAEYLRVNGSTLAGRLENTVSRCQAGSNDDCVALGAGIGEIAIGAVSAGAAVVGTRTAVVASRIPDVDVDLQNDLVDGSDSNIPLPTRAGIPDYIDLNSPSNVWGLDGYDLKTYYQGKGYSVSDTPAPSGASNLAQTFDLHDFRTVDRDWLTRVQFHPGGGIHRGSYYKFEIRNARENGMITRRIRVIDDQYNPLDIADYDEFFHADGRKIVYENGVWVEVNP